MKRSDDSQISAPVNYLGKIAYDHRTHSRVSNEQSCLRRPRIPLSVNRSKLTIPYRSQLCNLFQKGRCFYGGNCHFAHKVSEIIIPGLKTHVSMEEEHASERNSMRREEKYCNFSYRGEDCPYGDKCHFLHRCDENVERNGIGLNHRCDRSACDWIECGSRSEGRHNEKLIYHKTKLCMQWQQRFGSCRNGEKCTYAHGTQEVRGVGYYTRLEKSHGSRLMPYSRPSFAGSCRVGTEAAKKEGMVPIMDWNVAKTSEIYADWVGFGHDFFMSH